MHGEGQRQPQIDEDPVMSFKELYSLLDSD